MVQWIAAAPENADDVARPPGLVTIPADEDLRRLREACLGSDWWMCRFPDFDFAYLLKLLRALCKGDGSWLDENLLRVLVDWHDVYGDLWWYVPIYPWWFSLLNDIVGGRIGWLGGRKLGGRLLRVIQQAALVMTPKKYSHGGLDTDLKGSIS